MTPSRKIGSSAAAGAVTVILVWIASLLGVDVPAEAATAITTLVMFGTAYFIPERPSEASAANVPSLPEGSDE